MGWEERSEDRRREIPHFADSVRNDVTVVAGGGSVSWGRAMAIVGGGLMAEIILNFG